MNEVLIRRCERYDRELMREIVADGMRQLGYRPAGKLFVKPNVVIAHDPEVWGAHAYTSTELLGAALEALSSETGVQRIDVGENSAVGFPTRLCFKYAGYYDEVARVRQRARCPVDLFCMDEERRDTLFVGGLVHDTLRVSSKMARADSKIYLPKLKCHCVSNMTATVKLNIGICSDDERSIRHDFLLDDKIVDLLSAGWPDFVVVDAIDVGVGNEAFPVPRRLGLLLMGTNPIAVDLVGARLLGFGLPDIPYLNRAVERGYTPTSLEEVRLLGDIVDIDGLDEAAARIMPYDDEFYRWQDIHKELVRLSSPMRFFWGTSYRSSHGEQYCKTGCVMGLKMFLATFEQFAGAAAFRSAVPVVFVVGKVTEPIDAQGQEVFLLGSCAAADISNAKKIVRIDKCFTTASDMTFACAHKLGMPAITKDVSMMASLVSGVLRAAVRKCTSLRYFQDMAHFVTKSLERRI